MRERLMRSVDLIEEGLRENVVTPGDVTAVPTHPGDADVEGMDAQIEIAQNEEGLFEQVEAALERIEAGTFGSCEECGRAISPERLDAVPYAPLCIECAHSRDRDGQS
jgi:RNA polymerase-binding transcription factor DksA